MPPLIAIVAHTDENRFKMPAVNIPTAYTQAIELAGGIPYIVPFTKDVSLLPQMAGHAKGFLFPGGFDLDPAYFNESPIEKLGRVDKDLDKFQLAAFDLALKMKAPVLGICRGAQIINVALGGTLFQDIGSQFAAEVLDHMQKEIHFGTDHPIDIKQDSRLFKLFGSKIMVNSRHHQSIKDLGKNLRISAVSPDGVIEGAEHTHLPIDLVQWHPELMLLENRNMLPLMTEFIRQCR
ncbi:MAG: gamma-glutamyl-gamma-aminobutyrate hydrolase family protein [Desulfobacterales bacterium]|nr:gamma-glutamyl-gamma-aminobutyrate hydrolase family protein [Desulfobacterales bacterium]